MEIKHRYNGSVLFECGTPTFKAALERAVIENVNLTDADLTGANLTGAYLRGADLTGANLRDANLRGADLTGANLRNANITDADLRDANLRDANLTDANLRDADLRGAYLRGADLTGANLRDANLTDANGLNKYLTTSLWLLVEQPTPILRAYKLTTREGAGPFNGGIIYEVGKTYDETEKADCDENRGCGAGINVASLDWCLKEWREGYRIFVVEFDKADIAAIPIGSDGKFRLKKCKVVREVDLKGELGWGAATDE